MPMLRLHRSALVLSAFLAFAAPLAGCATHYIPNTDVEDNEENRKLIGFCERYRHAVESEGHRDPPQARGAELLRGRRQRRPDGRHRLRGPPARTSRASSRTHSSIRYEIRYRRVKKERDLIYVEYTYSASYRIPGSKGDEWRRKVEDNRLELVPYQDEYRIVSGM